jgi:hypothetical protein
MDLKGFQSRKLTTIWVRLCWEIIKGEEDAEAAVAGEKSLRARSREYELNNS